MKHRYYPILLLYFFQAACMPEEDLPIRHTGETPEYFIECYCQPGRPFALSATSVLPVSEDLQIDFSKEMKVTIHADKAISLIHALYTLPGSEFIYNYGSPEKFEVRYIDSLFLDITTIDNKSITASTSIPPAVSIYNCQVAGNEAIIRFYISEKADENYYIYTAEAVHADSILNKEVCYLDYSEFQQEGLTEKRVSKKYLAPSIYSYPYWRLKSNIRFYKGVFCLFGHPLLLFNHQPETGAVNVLYLYILIVFKIFPQFSHINIHTSGCKIIIGSPYLGQCFLTG